MSYALASLGKGILFGDGNATTISAGAEHTCMVTELGVATCWVAAENGDLGYGDIQPIGDN